MLIELVCYCVVSKVAKAPNSDGKKEGGNTPKAVVCCAQRMQPLHGINYPLPNLLLFPAGDGKDLISVQTSKASAISCTPCLCQLTAMKL